MMSRAWSLIVRALFALFVAAVLVSGSWARPTESNAYRLLLVVSRDASDQPVIQWCWEWKDIFGKMHRSCTAPEVVAEQ